MADPKPPFGKRQTRNLPKPQVRVDAAAAPSQKRSLLLGPVGIGAAALLGIGAITTTNGFGLGGTRPDCTASQVAVSITQCEAIQSGPQCGAAFARGAAAVGLTRRGTSGPWSIEPLTAGAGSAYLTALGQPFTARSTCRSSSSTRSVFWGGGSGGSSAGSNTSGAATSQSQAVNRSGFGSTARSFSSSSRGG